MSWMTWQPFRSQRAGERRMQGGRVCASAVRRAAARGASVTCRAQLTPRRPRDASPPRIDPARVAREYLPVPGNAVVHPLLSNVLSVRFVQCLPKYQWWWDAADDTLSTGEDLRISHLGINLLTKVCSVREKSDLNRLKSEFHGITSKRVMKCIMFETRYHKNYCAENITMTAQNYVQDVLLWGTFTSWDVIVALKTLPFPTYRCEKVFIINFEFPSEQNKHNKCQDKFTQLPGTYPYNRLRLIV